MLASSTPDNTMETIEPLKKKKTCPSRLWGCRTGSSRKSAANSVIWHFGEDISMCPTSDGGVGDLAGPLRPFSLIPGRRGGPAH
ncbi:MAG: hypothetical protein R2875_03930 [Desulfobacterales bacterium]